MPARPRLWAVICLLLFGIALPAKLWLVSTWHAPAGDGIDYFQLSQELFSNHRFAYGPPPLGESWARMPGYPLFLAFVAVRKASISIEAHLVHATRANVALDIGTAIFVLLILREFRRGDGRSSGVRSGGVAQVIGCGLALFYPLQLLLSTYGLSESLATFLATLEMLLALRAMRTRIYLHAILCGVVAGIAQLVRMDALVTAPAVLLAIFYAHEPLRRRLFAMALFIGILGAIFAPWPLRNLQRFGKPHASGAYLRDRQNGNPLPDGIISWARTWATGAPGEAYLDLELSLNKPLEVNRFATATFDVPAERQQLAEIIDHYNQEQLSPRVDAEFRQLARERFARRPLRILLLLPMLRILHLWAPLPEGELPLRVPALHLPERRNLFRAADRLLYGIALCGMMMLLFSTDDSRRRFWIFAAAIGARNLLYGFAVPNAVNQRFIVEALPLLYVLCAVGIGSLVEMLSDLGEGEHPATAGDSVSRYKTG